MDISYILDKLNVLIIVLGIVAMFVMSLMQRKKPIREYFNKIPMPVRWIVLAGVLILIASFGVNSSFESGGFLYEQF